LDLKVSIFDMAKTNDSSSTTAELEEKETKDALNSSVVEGKGYLRIGGKSLLEILSVPSLSA
jgi:hypothetical protein